MTSPANAATATTRTSHSLLHLGTGLKRALHAPLGLIPWPSKAERGMGLSSYHTKCFGQRNSDKPNKITETREGRPNISLTWFKHRANALEVNFISDSPITLKNENTERHQQNNFNLNKKYKFGTNNVTRNKENLTDKRKKLAKISKRVVWEESIMAVCKQEVTWPILSPLWCTVKKERAKDYI